MKKQITSLLQHNATLSNQREEDVGNIRRLSQQVDDLRRQEEERRRHEDADNADDSQRQRELAEYDQHDQE